MIAFQQPPQHSGEQQQSARAAASGLLLFSRVLVWLLDRYRDALLSLLTGFMAMALVKLWPWQALGTDQNSSSSGVFSYLRWPQEYAQGGDEAFMLLVVIAGCLGGLSVWLLSKFAQR